MHNCIWEVEARESGVRHHPQPRRQCEVSLCFKRLYLKPKQKTQVVYRQLKSIRGALLPLHDPQPQVTFLCVTSYSKLLQEVCLVHLCPQHLIQSVVP